ncbi:MAG: hypothetical protein L3J18_00270 [Candidatus Brocadia sp.]|nr:MAG: hypothetical protein L3J18_00270 [Candidatus Brocadia sp.]
MRTTKYHLCYHPSSFRRSLLFEEMKGIETVYPDTTCTLTIPTVSVQSWTIEPAWTGSPNRSSLLLGEMKGIEAEVGAYCNTLLPKFPVLGKS